MLLVPVGFPSTVSRLLIFVLKGLHLSMSGTSLSLIINKTKVGKPY